jgi:hypothetical protein
VAAAADFAPATRGRGQDHTQAGRLEEVLGELLGVLASDGTSRGGSSSWRCQW